MASVILSVVPLFLLLLSADALLPRNADDEGTAFALPLDAPKDGEPTEVLIPLVDKTKVDLPALVDGFDQVGVSLVPPFHRHRHRHCRHCHLGHRLRDRRVVVPYGDDMISEPKHGELSSFSDAATDVVVPEEVKKSMVAEWNKEDEKDCGWRIWKKEHKQKKRTEDSDSNSDSDSESDSDSDLDSDSDSDSDDEGMEMGKKELRKKKMKGKKEKGGWLKSFWVLWD